MRLSLLILPVLLLAGCEASSAPKKPDDADAPAKPAPPPSKSAGTGEPPPDAGLTPPDPDSAEAAVDVLDTYYALIAAGKYREAWALWGHGGTDSGMTADQFAASFDKYASYTADIGTPGRTDAGMSQRWIEIPVTITGKLKDGSAVKMGGPVILHHIAREVDGATEAEKNWHIRDTSGVKPVP